MVCELLSSVWFGQCMYACCFACVCLHDVVPEPGCLFGECLHGCCSTLMRFAVLQVCSSFVLNNA